MIRRVNFPFSGPQGLMAQRSMVAFSGTEFDIDDKDTISPAHRLTGSVVDLRKQGGQDDVKREDPIQVFQFNDPLFPKQWHLVCIVRFYYLLTLIV